MPEILADSESSAQQLGQLLLGPDLTVVPELVTGLVHFASLYIFYIALHPRTSLYIVYQLLLDCWTVIGPAIPTFSQSQHITSPGLDPTARTVTGRGHSIAEMLQGCR